MNLDIEKEYIEDEGSEIGNIDQYQQKLAELELEISVCHSSLSHIKLTEQQYLQKLESFREKISNCNIIRQSTPEKQLELLEEQIHLQNHRVAEINKEAKNIENQILQLEQYKKEKYQLKQEVQKQVNDYHQNHTSKHGALEKELNSKRSAIDKELAAVVEQVLVIEHDLSRLDILLDDGIVYSAVINNLFPKKELKEWIHAMDVISGERLRTIVTDTAQPVQSIIRKSKQENRSVTIWPLDRINRDNGVSNRIVSIRNTIIGDKSINDHVQFSYDLLNYNSRLQAAVERCYGSYLLTSSDEGVYCYELFALLN
jgi:chromosome segregation ATPase